MYKYKVKIICRKMWVMLSPQERENRLPRFGVADAMGGRSFLATNCRETARARKASEYSERVAGCSLSPGERVGGEGERFLSPQTIPPLPLATGHVKTIVLHDCRIRLTFAA